ncbi:hypothetical protein CPLU01_06948 [Colletotrichum plurivorum]|uniref:Uncharacterized protein n=1 Tax=Colletotrichum plurivorum TaxID=2175906 RepID=A0A8H6NFX1_9PEZI|nr:hypothetical protein CPLU01_06948 [Colletotrichum plurivorum]
MYSTRCLPAGLYVFDSEWAITVSSVLLLLLLARLSRSPTYRPVVMSGTDTVVVAAAQRRRGRLVGMDKVGIWGPTIADGGGAAEERQATASSKGCLESLDRTLASTAASKHVPRLHGDHGSWQLDAARPLLKFTPPRENVTAPVLGVGDFAGRTLHAALHI